MPSEKVEVFKSLEGWASEWVLPLLKPVEQLWQPQDFIPDPAQPFDAFSEQVRELRDRTAELPDEYLVVLVGDMITEDALPTYQTMINTLDGVRDGTGASASPWAKWTRSWTAEENHHGDLLRTYLYLSGRVDMRMIERTMQYLISAGMVSDLEFFSLKDLKRIGVNEKDFLRKFFDLGFVKFKSNGTKAKRPLGQIQKTQGATKKSNFFGFTWGFCMDFLGNQTMMNFPENRIGDGFSWESNGG